MTREQYMTNSIDETDADKEAKHRQYYGQYVTPYIRARVLGYFGDRLFKVPDSDVDLNSLPLREWDFLARSGLGALAVPMKDNGDYLTLGSAVCILKEAARRIIESNKESSK